MRKMIISNSGNSQEYDATKLVIYTLHIEELANHQDADRKISNKAKIYDLELQNEVLVQKVQHEEDL